MEDKRKYYKLQLSELEKISALDKKPTLLMHVCCGPCTSGALLEVCEHFDVTLTYNNSNIYPKSEWERRLWTLEEMLKKFEAKYSYHIKLIPFAYEGSKYTHDVLSKYPNEVEGGKRCHECYEARMLEAYSFASENGFDYFTTVMTISRQKDSLVLNSIGEKLSHRFPNTKYFYSDFKKGGGQVIKHELTSEFELYDQNYCGCVYTYQDGQKRNLAALGKQKENELNLAKESE